jgi:ribosomal protein S12 methylthiotransferase
MKKHHVNIITMGCSKNLVDSEVLMKQLNLNGVLVDHEGERDDYNTIIINTCGFIHDAKEESIDKILAYVEAKENGSIENLFVTGCLSERYKDDLRKEIPEVDKFFGVNDLTEILNTLKFQYSEKHEHQRIVSTPSHYAFLKIAEGCNRTCSFCAIPLIRGKYMSRTIDSLYDEALKLSNEGIKELLVIAQDTSYYGYDLYKKYALPELVSKISSIDSLEWIKLHYLYPNNFPLEILDLMQNKSNICKYLDLPFQHVSDNMLERMRRNFTKEQSYELINTIREKVPDIHLRTTFMTGFPGETEQDFKELVDFIEKTKFERLGVFTYSNEEDTFAYSNYKDEIPLELKNERAEILMDIQRNISLELNRMKIGQKLKVIIDEESDGQYIGRTAFDSPEVDGTVIIDSFKELHIGEFYNVIINSVDEYDLYAIM